jgi:hypothetical protein
MEESPEHAIRVDREEIELVVQTKSGNNKLFS